MDQYSNNYGEQKPSPEMIAEKAYATIAKAFPVCAFSDEFYFFPQVAQKDKDWRAWDDFSVQKVAGVADILHGTERDLSELVTDDLSGDDQVDVDLLRQLLRTLREQLIEVGPHRSQPSFHLTVLADRPRWRQALPRRWLHPNRAPGRGGWPVRPLFSGAQRSA